jgi:hypothetical protein
VRVRGVGVGGEGKQLHQNDFFFLTASLGVSREVNAAATKPLLCCFGGIREGIGARIRRNASNASASSAVQDVPEHNGPGSLE